MSETFKLDLSLFGTATLGSLRSTLAQRCVAQARVQFDFCYLRPTILDSYRGYYDHLAIGWADDGAWPSVFDFHDMLLKADQRRYEGWKGGGYWMNDRTPLWVANRGESGGTGIVAIEADEGTVVLITAKVD